MQLGVGPTCMLLYTDSSPLLVCLLVFLGNAFQLKICFLSNNEKYRALGQTLKKISIEFQFKRLDLRHRFALKDCLVVRM